MGKSQETWNKKETEKKRLKKKKDKEEKKQERRANQKTSGGFDDMIAYVDEHGQLSSTPPDPTKKIKIKEEDIVISIAKQENLKPEDLIRKGVVSFFNDSKGYGFIKDLETQNSVFVHINGLIDSIKENNIVTYEVEMGQKGPNAVKVKLVR